MGEPVPVHELRDHLPDGWIAERERITNDFVSFVFMALRGGKRVVKVYMHDDVVDPDEAVS